MGVFIIIIKERPMESPSNNMIVNKFREGVFNYIIKPDVIRMTHQQGQISIIDIILKDEFDVNDYNNTIYLYFDVILVSGLFMNKRTVQESVVKTIKSGINAFYPSNEFVILPVNITILYESYKSK